MHKSKLFVACSFFVLSILACSTIDNLREKTTLSITSPSPDFRMIEEPHLDGTPVQTLLSVQLNTTRKENISATVYLDGVAKTEPCILAPNAETSCGLLDLYNKGQHTVRVDVVNLSGEIISSEVAFLWEPYIGWDATALKFAQIAGSQNPTLGFYLMGLVVMALFAVAFGAFTRTSQGTVFGIIVSTFMFIFMFIYYRPEVAANLFLALIGLVSSSVVAGVVVYAISQGYEARAKDKIYLSRTDEFGNPEIADIQLGARLGKGNGGSDIAAVSSAFFNAGAKSGQPREPQIQHFIDGQLITEEQFQLMATNPQRTPSRQNSGILHWLFGSSRKNSNQKRLR